MSMYNIQQYLDKIPEILGQKKQKEDPRDEEFRKKWKNGIPKNRIDDDKELMEQAKNLGLKTPRKW